MNLTTEQIAQLMAVLPGCRDERKRQLVPMILSEWGRNDVEEHLNRKPPQQVTAERKLLEKLASCATELAQAFSSLPPGPRFAVAYELSKGKVVTETALANYNRISEIGRRLGEAPATLESLAAAATETAARWGPLSLRHDSVIRYLIMKDLAAIFEYATEQLSGRRVRTDAHVDAGQDYGPFWDFVSVVWPMIFGSTNGLTYAVRYWAGARRKHGEWSPVILNMDLRHPEWRIFGR